MTANAIDAEVKRRIAVIQQREHDALAAQIRAEAEAELAAERAANERQARVAQIRERITVELDTSPLEAVRTNLRTALIEYMATCRDYDQKHSDLWNELLSLANGGPMPPDLEAQTIYGGMVSAGGVDYRKSRIQTTLANTAREVFREYYPRHQFDLGRPQD